MTDAAKPKPGWYVILEDGKVKTCWYLADPGAWHVAAPDYPAVCIEDLLRDAAEAKRLREIVNTIVPMAGCFDPDNEEQVEEIGLEWSKRYHAAKRDAERLSFAHRYPMTFRVFCSRSTSVEERNALIDANIAREKRP